MQHGSEMPQIGTKCRKPEDLANTHQLYTKAMPMLLIIRLLLAVLLTGIFFLVKFIIQYLPYAT